MTWPEAFLWAVVVFTGGIVFLGSIALIMIFRNPPWRENCKRDKDSK